MLVYKLRFSPHDMSQPKHGTERAPSNYFQFETSPKPTRPTMDPFLTFSSISKSLKSDPNFITGSGFEFF